MSEAALRIEGLRKSYDRVVALDGVDVVLGEGEVVGLLGPNGAGKTTMVSIICGLRRADAGSVSVRGVDALAHPEAARRHIGLAPQELGIYPIDKVRQNLRLFAELCGLRGAELRREIDSVATALRLTDLMDRKAGELSGGQKRRLHTAIALLNHPSLILLDEATVGADVETRAAVIEVVKGLARRGSAVLYSTHYLDEVEALDARVIIMDQGRVIAEGSVLELTSQNGGSYVELTFEDSVRRVQVTDPGREMAEILAGLGAEVSRLHRVEVINASLETVFLKLTGRRYEPGEEADVVAS